MNLIKKIYSANFINCIKLLLFVFLFKIIAVTAYGAEIDSINTIENKTQKLVSSLEENSILDQGKLYFSSNFYFDYSSKNGPRNSVTFTSEYFVLDRLSIGGSIHNLDAKGINRFGLGPSISYHLLNSNIMATTLGLEILYDTFKIKQIEPEKQFTTNIKIGFEWFALSNIAIGPSFLLSRPLKKIFAQESSTVKSVLFQLSLYL